MRPTKSWGRSLSTPLEIGSLFVVLTRAHFLKIVLTFGRATDSPGKLAYACIVNAGHRPAMQQNMMQQNISSSVMLSERVSLALSQPVTALPHVEAEYFAMVRIRTRSAMLRSWLKGRDQQVRMDLHHIQGKSKPCTHLLRIAAKDDGRTLA